MSRFTRRLYKLQPSPRGKVSDLPVDSVPGTSVAIFRDKIWIATPPGVGLHRGSMYEVTVEDTFAAGHYLRNYKGKCENPHGHNYKVRVTLAGQELDKAGLLLDFKELREVMKHAIERLDHQMINDLEPFTILNPSAENLAKYFYDESNTRLARVTNGRVHVKSVTVFETDTTTATFSE